MIYTYLVSANLKHQKEKGEIGHIMNVSRLGSINLVEYAQRSQQSNKEPAKKHIEQLPNKNLQEQCHFTYRDELELERISNNDLSLYDEVQRYPKSQQIKKLFSLSIHV